MMDYLLAENAGPCAQSVRLPSHLGTHFLSQHDDVVKKARTALQPFDFRVMDTHEGVQVDGDQIAVMLASRILEQIGETIPKNGRTEVSKLDDTISTVVNHMLKRDLVFRLKGLPHPVRPMTLSQVAFLRTLLSPHERLVIGAGPTGTGKTHLAIVAGLNQLASERVKHIVLTRPHVVMDGEVVTPSTRKELEYDQQFDYFEDILRDLLGYTKFSRLVEQRLLEIIPLGRMRGRTFNESFVIVDEAQNMTIRTMRMAVTRIGRASRMVVTGDPAQVDLRSGEASGLPHLMELLEGTGVASVHRFEINQIVRNSIVAELERLYSDQENRFS